MNRRSVLAGLVALLAGTNLARADHERWLWGDLDDDEDEWPPRRYRRKVQRRIARRKSKRRRGKVAQSKRRAPRRSYEGRSTVAFDTGERPGTVIVKTRERALYYVLGGGKAVRYGVAVGKAGYTWSGTARIGNKVEWPDWTPPAEMIERKPELAEWAYGMPGGIPENPLGARALYLYQGRRDTLYRIHGTNAPGSIGTAASSGCIRMLNEEVIELYGRVGIGTKVIVL